MCRIIPAYAGSTTGWAAPENSVEDHPRIRGEHGFQEDGAELLSLDHPRIRGEHLSIHAWRALPMGSSPHTRGAHVTEIQALGGVRIIPAYAGSTTGWAAPGISGEDHPRIRGEHPIGPVAGDGGVRIIPAYAGSTFSFPVPGAFLPDHPRIRGEHS